MARFWWARFHQGSGNWRWMAEREPVANSRGISSRASASIALRFERPREDARYCTSRANFLRHSKATYRTRGCRLAYSRANPPAPQPISSSSGPGKPNTWSQSGGASSPTNSGPAGSGRISGRLMGANRASPVLAGQGPPGRTVSAISAGRNMRVFHSVPEAQRTLAGAALALGNFDGVHLGHQALFAEARRHGPAWAFTFDPHPGKVLQPDLAPKLINVLPRKLELMAEAGLEGAVVQPFTTEYAHTSPEDFE